MKRDIQTQMSWAEGINIVPRVYIITVASSETDGLRALLTSANLAGVIVEVNDCHAS